MATQAVQGAQDLKSRIVEVLGTRYLDRAGYDMYYLAQRLGIEAENNWLERLMEMLIELRAEGKLVCREYRLWESPFGTEIQISFPSWQLAGK